MIRKELCAVTSMTAPTFNSHRRNGDLPFSMAGLESKDGKGTTWARFTAFEAALLIAAKTLTAQGMGWREATRMLRTESTGTGGKVAMINRGISIARVEFCFGRRDVLQGPIDRIIATSGAIAAREKTEIMSVISVNVSACLGIAEARMKELGVGVDADFLGSIEPEAGN